jgi:hypothetical protein
MIIWATFAMMITALPIVVWRHMVRQDRKRAAAADGLQGSMAAPPEAAPAPFAPQSAPHAPPAPHAPRHKPSWAASGPGNGGSEQTMQIALGGLGGRKE